MNYTVLMLRFQEDGSVPTRRLAGSFLSPEAAFAAGRHEIMVERADQGTVGFQIHDQDGKMIYEVRSGEPNG